MNTRMKIKLALGLGGGILFWGLAVMIFVAYAFMPRSKDPHQFFFIIGYPIIYILSFDYFLIKIFNESGWRVWLINTGIIIFMAFMALIILDWLMSVSNLLMG